ncbi:calcium-binding protein [Tabrizicola oligotrophica]|uniref:Calcium-binding protein n=1 Tax=Tabrizicola oligotrophica TaxID=2710650 RepID=A0A6M0QNM5_9RHOB|nr:calcium-binding protein [Tabrizicola oligotrophica]NEY88691.1 calcium-binding protein [Tabrizicola oligotrophica]
MALISGTNLPDILTGTIENDTLRGLLADDVLYGFDGNDVLEGGAGEDFLYGGSGWDIASYANATAGLTLNLVEPAFSTGDAAGDVTISIEEYLLTGFNDIAIGSARADVIRGGAGKDLLQGGAGNDTLSGDGGADTLMGGAGADRLQGGAGVDVASYLDADLAVVINLGTLAFSGGAAGDTLVSIERLVLSSLADAVTLAGAVGHVEGGAGNDTVLGRNGADSLFGGAGVDILEGLGGDDLLSADGHASGGAAQFFEQLLGGAGNDTLLGGVGGAILMGDAGNDQLRGEGGNDALIGGFGADTLNGGAGIDSVSYDEEATVNMADQTGNAGAALGDRLISIEALTLAGGGTYIGGTQAVRVDGSGGSLAAFAGAGAETFVNVQVVDYGNATTGITFACVAGTIPLVGGGGAAGDVLEGAPQELVLSGFDDEVDLTGSLLATFNATTGDGDDRIVLDSQFGEFVTGNGNDSILGGAGTSTFDLGEGSDFVSLGGVGASFTIQGGAGADSISAGLFDSAMIDGGSGDDTLDATGGSATLTGGIGNDNLTLISANALAGLPLADGGAGNDSITGTAFVGSFLGGEGNDILTVTALLVSAGRVIVDGGAGNDIITLDSDAPDSVLPAEATEVRGGAGDDTINGLFSALGLAFEHFVFETGWGIDELNGFEMASDDRIVFDGITGLDAGTLAVTENLAGNTVLSFDGNSVEIVGLALSAFDIGRVDFL